MTGKFPKLIKANAAITCSCGQGIAALEFKQQHSIYITPPKAVLAHIPHLPSFLFLSKYYFMEYMGNHEGGLYKKKEGRKSKSKRNEKKSP